VRQLAWSLIPLGIIAGLAVGYLVRGQQVKTEVTTVVQIQTVAPPPPGTNTMTVTLQGAQGICLTTDTDHSNVTGDTFTLRAESNGLNEGTILAVSDDQALDDQGCDLVIHYSVSPDLGFFYVHDDTHSGRWGPFDSHKMKTNGWRLRLYY
jgi:hypothetical protein